MDLGSATKQLSDRRRLRRALAIADERKRAEAFAGLIPELSADLLGEALAAVRGITDAAVRARGLAELVARLPDDQQGPVLGEAWHHRREGAGVGVGKYVLAVLDPCVERRHR